MDTPYQGNPNLSQGWYGESRRNLTPGERVLDLGVQVALVETGSSPSPPIIQTGNSFLPL